VYDLHIHTSHSSDGQYGPGEILRMAKACNLKGLAFTDHMDTSAVAEGMLLASSYGLDFISGVELSTAHYGREYHLLVYGFHPDNGIIKGFLEQHCRAIWDKALEILNVFTQMGFDIRKDDIQAWGLSVPTGVTFLNALIKRNQGDKRLEEYLCGAKASSPYLNFYKDYALTDIGTMVRSALPDLRETMRLLKDSGVFILAHPGNTDTAILKELKDEGLCGIEAYSTHHTTQEIERLVGVARELDLLVSAGSDFHGDLIKPGIHLGDSCGRPDEELISRLSGMAKVVA
jgi:predicted metal-dependent phosphoesterase TrpH